MLPSQFLEEIPDELIDWKRRETGSERMRTGWGDGDEFGGWDDEDDFSSGPTFGTASYGSYGSSHGSAYGSGSTGRWGSAAHRSNGSRSGSTYGSGRSSGTYGSSSRYGSHSSGTRGGRISTRHVTPKNGGTSMPVSSLQKDNGLNIGDFFIGDYVTHDQYGLGKVVDLQDKGRNSVITIDFGSDGVKRLMLRVAPIEKL